MVRAAPIGIAVPSNGSVRIRMSGEAGVEYFVRTTDDLVTPAWRLARTNAVTGTGGTSEVDVAASAIDRGFWRVESDYEYRAGLFIQNYQRQLDAGGPATLTVNGQSAQNTISIEEDRAAGQLVITGNGVPNYKPMVAGLEVTDGWNTPLAGGFQSIKLSENNQGAAGGNNPNRIVVANEIFRIPLHPVNNPAATDTALGTVGVAINGIPIYNPFEDQNQTAAAGRIFSSCCGHPQLTGVYHYHKYPTCLKLLKGDVWQSEQEKCDELDALLAAGGHSPLIGFALDGWPVYGPVGWRDTNRVSKLLKSSYTGANDTAGNPAYVAGSGDLDDCNGLVSPTPEFPEGIYHYVMSIEADTDGRVLRYINPYFGYDIRNTLKKHDLMPADWTNDTSYINALKAGFSAGGIAVPGTDSYSTFYNFVVGLTGLLRSNALAVVADEFQTMKISYPYTIRKYRGTPSNAGGGGGGGTGGTGVTGISPSEGLPGFAYPVVITLQALAGTPGLPPTNAPITVATVGGISLLSPVRSSTTTVTGRLLIPENAAAGSRDVIVSFQGPPGQPAPSYSGTAAFSVVVPGGTRYTDNADAYAVWTNGMNQGSGFGAWSLSNSASAGFFVSNGDANLSVDSSKGFGLYAELSGRAEAARSFVQPLSTGDTFAMSFDNNFIQSGGETALVLIGQDGSSLLKFYFTGGESNYRITDKITGRDSGIPYTGNGLVLRIQISSNGSYSLRAGSQLINGELSSNAAVHRFAMINVNAGSGSNHNLYLGRHSYWDVP